MTKTIAIPQFLDSLIRAYATDPIEAGCVQRACRDLVPSEGDNIHANAEITDETLREHSGAHAIAALLAWSEDGSLPQNLQLREFIEEVLSLAGIEVSQ